MTITVPTSPQNIEDPRIGAVCSASRWMVPAAQQINYLAGHVLCGQQILQVNAYGNTAYGTSEYKVWRHPNCDAVGVLAYVNVTKSASITSTAGGGDPVVVSVDDSGRELIAIQCLWDSGDTGQQTVDITTTDGCYIEWITVIDVPRVTLEATEISAPLDDGTYPNIGCLESQAICADTRAGPERVMYQLGVLRQTAPKIQAVAWSSYLGVTSSSGSWTNPLGSSNDFTWYHQARTDTSDSTVAYQCDVKTKCAAGVTYSVRLSSGADSVEATGLTNTSAAWQDLGTLDIDATAEDTITVEVIVTAGAGDVTLYRVSVEA